MGIYLWTDASIPDLYTEAITFSKIVANLQYYIPH